MWYWCERECWKFGVDICIRLGDIARKRERSSKAPNTFVKYCTYARGGVDLERDAFWRTRAEWAVWVEARSQWLSRDFLKDFLYQKGRRNVRNIVGARCRVQHPTLLMTLWWRDSKILQTIWSCVNTSIWCFLRLCRCFNCGIDHNIAKVCLLWLAMRKRVFLSQNIVGAEYIVCTHWLNIVDAPYANEGMYLYQKLKTQRIWPTIFMV